MNRLDDLPADLIEEVAGVVQTLLGLGTGLQPADIMVVGAICRDIHHHALGHRFATSATSDLDLALALRSWQAFDALADAFATIGTTGIGFDVHGTHLDVIPFGEIEDPDGVSRPPTRAEHLGVWALSEIHAYALDLSLPTGESIAVPTVAGYAAAKLGAWLDRSAWFETKDARDLAVVAFWYADSTDVQNILYDTEEGNSILADESADLLLASVRCLGRDVAALVGPGRLAELLQR